MRKRIMEIDKEKDRNILAAEKKWFPFYKALDADGNTFRYAKAFQKCIFQTQEL